MEDFKIDEDELDIEDLDSDYEPVNKTKKKRAAKRIDEVNEKLKEIGLSFNGTKVAAWTDEGIERHLNSFAAEIPNSAQAYIAYITPLQFLKLTTGDNPRTVDRINEESSKYGELEFDKLGDTLPMFLHIEEGKTSARVIGHEGRHRMKLLGDAGFEKIPVLLLNYDNKYSKVTLNNLKLKPQSFNDDGFISKSRDVIIEEAIPFSRENKAAKDLNEVFNNENYGWWIFNKISGKGWEASDNLWETGQRGVSKTNTGRDRANDTVLRVFQNTN